MNNSNVDQVRRATTAILKHLDETRDLSSTKADLAHLRNSIGKPINEAAEVWPLLFQYMPPELLSERQEANHAELAVLTTLQLYALHQQGRSESVLEMEWENMGPALKVLRKESKDESKAIDRRFNTLVTSTSFEELAHHLRQMVKLLRSNRQAKVNYTVLAGDLFNFLNHYDDSVKISWSRDYYRAIKREGEQEDETK